MQLISMQEVQQGSLVILKKIDEICKQLNLKYCLAYGTLISAIRHGEGIRYELVAFASAISKNKNVFNIKRSTSIRISKIVSDFINKVDLIEI